MLSIRNLAFLDYGPFTFSINAGEGISVQGSSGTGKSLLLRAIADLDRHTGEVSLNNQLQNTMPAPDWRRQTGYLFADAVFWADTVAEHFDATQSPFLRRGIQALQVESLLRQPVARLSGGEKQRLALLRLLTNQPKALLLDEPTSHLDPDTTLVVESIIADYQCAQRCPLILVSHDERQCARMTSRHYAMRKKSLREISS